eukprot:CAMPEP_0183319298 /NCGR_PEP_ID=MMETSP0160_2-20130417/63156_1 /TAXON_ID=2839 ORGANISM="Odontella Sinensis, Strain Grunow 1884" /NCGR_SAMPLE_ID=MMETSP0160_2 /ASSEMBLY_ACC=CAM_ASM_000250 /LENGTH=53 /DNA_ID=CAMNT_0025485749 /DNA_START=141 /DNA_END=299 /DNA_ORIENTATION=+
MRTGMVTSVVSDTGEGVTCALAISGSSGPASLTMSEAMSNPSTDVESNSSPSS